MKQHTAEFKQELVKMGKQIDSIITYQNNGETITLHDELFKVTPLFEANLMKSVMKQLEVESSVAIPYGTIINYQLGVKVGNSFEYLDYGNYVVFSNEKQEDTNTYKITCYDKMIYSMKPYDKITGNYPMTIKAYLGLLATKIGLTLKDTNFYNYSLEIQTDLYEDLEYTYRDVLDEIAQATGSIIIINASDQLEVIYPTNSGDTINEEYFKDVNVNFKEKYGPINSIVLSRAGESDNVYIQDEDSIRANGLCEVKIVDNQIMNFNDRSDYLQGLLDALGGVEYYINDFESIGVLYYDIGDYYNVTIGNNTYKCLMLNREINVTSGIEEIIHTDMPEQGETDYTKADKTDRRINQTYMIVDKQNQTIQSVVTKVDEQNDKITQIQQTTDDIETQVSNMYNATKTITGIKTVVMEKCIKGYLLKLRIKGNNSVFGRLYPADDLYPDDTLYPQGDSRIIVTDENGNSMMYELRVNEVLRANNEVYDEYILENNFAKVIRRVNPDGTTKINEEVENIGTYTIYVSQGTNTITIKNYSASIEAVYVEQNAYTDQFATKIEMSSAITQTAEEINTEVRKKVGENEIISKINQTAEEVSIDANKININGVISANGNFEVDEEGNMLCKNGTFSGDIYTSNNGKLASASQGVMSTLFATSNGPLTSYDYLGYLVDMSGQKLQRSSPFVSVYIPDNFTPVYAYLIMEQTQPYFITNAGNTYGRAYDIKVRKGAYSPSFTLQGFVGEYTMTMSEISGTDITNTAYGSSTITPNVGMTVSNNIANQLSKGSLNVISAYTNNSTYDNVPVTYQGTEQLNAGSITGLVKLSLQIIGYLNPY